MWIDSLREFGVRLARQVRQPRFESEMDDELQFHIEMQTDQWVRSGMSPDQARRRALIEFGGLEQTREHCRDAVGVRLANDIVKFISVKKSNSVLARQVVARFSAEEGAALIVRAKVAYCRS